MVVAAKQKQSLMEQLPALRGRLRAQADLSAINWFRVGGPAEVLFRPEDAADLAEFMKHKPSGVRVTVLGVGSNLLVRDGGIDGVVIRLGRGFTELTLEEDTLHAGAACLSLNAALFAADNGRADLEFLSGIPGTIGGALAMNAGAYGSETAQQLVSAQLVDGAGNLREIGVDELGYRYRHCSLPEGAIFTRASFRTRPDNPLAIHDRIHAIQTEREASQPIRSRTGGSTFKNPEGHKAWKLIDEAGCRGLTMGGAQVSEKHCNFLINTGEATAADLEALGEEVRRRVKAHSGIELEWEIKRIGKHKAGVSI